MIAIEPISSQSFYGTLRFKNLISDINGKRIVLHDYSIDTKDICSIKPLHIDIERFVDELSLTKIKKDVDRLKASIQSKINNYTCILLNDSKKYLAEIPQEKVNSAYHHVLKTDELMDL